MTKLPKCTQIKMIWNAFHILKGCSNLLLYILYHRLLTVGMIKNIWTVHVFAITKPVNRLLSGEQSNISIILHRKSVQFSLTLMCSVVKLYFCCVQSILNHTPHTWIWLVHCHSFINHSLTHWFLAIIHVV